MQLTLPPYSQQGKLIRAVSFQNIVKKEDERKPVTIPTTNPVNQFP